MQFFQILYVVALTAIFSTCSGQPQDPQTLQVTHLTTAEFAAIINNGGILLDVRTPNEYREAHLENASELDYYSNDFEKNALALPKDKDVYVYCMKGGRSASASEILLKQGHPNVYNLLGGIHGWESEGLPVVE
jgi:rhodanese-related sulfurtransferase